MRLAPKTLELARWALPGLTDRSTIVVCRRCNHQVIFDGHMVSSGYYAYCPWHDEDLYSTETFDYDFMSWRKSIRFFAKRLDFHSKFVILKMRLRKG